MVLIFLIPFINLIMSVYMLVTEGANGPINTVIHHRRRLGFSIQFSTGGEPYLKQRAFILFEFNHFRVTDQDRAICGIGDSLVGLRLETEIYTLHAACASFLNGRLQIGIGTCKNYFGKGLVARCDDHFDGDLYIDAFFFEHERLFITGSFHLAAHSAAQYDFKTLLFEMRFEEALFFDKFPRLFFALFVFFDAREVKNLAIDGYSCQHLIEKPLKVILMPCGLILAHFAEYRADLALEILSVNEKRCGHWLYCTNMAVY